MHDTTTTTPNGQTIIVLDDEAFAAYLGLAFPSRTYSQLVAMTPLREALLRALWQYGPIEHPSGLAARKLLDLARTFDARVEGSGASAVLAAPAFAACTERSIEGRRTFSITLAAMPQRWLDLMPVPEPEPVIEVEPEPEEVIEVSVQPPTTEVANAVATALLARVVEIVGSGKVDTADRSQLERNLADVSQRLASQLEYSERLRREGREAGELIAALKLEVEGLRRRLRETEHNLSVATSADAQRIIDAEVRRQLDRVMRQAPGNLNGRREEAPAR